MKKWITMLLTLIICIVCGNIAFPEKYDVQAKTEKKDTTIILNDTLSLYYASYNRDMKLWYNLYLIKKKKRIQLEKGSQYKGVGSELFFSLSPDAHYVVVDAIIKGYRYESGKDSTLHENYKCAIIDLKKAKTVDQMQQDCDGSWNQNNQWVSSDGKVVFE